MLYAKELSMNEEKILGVLKTERRFFNLPEIMGKTMIKQQSSLVALSRLIARGFVEKHPLRGRMYETVNNKTVSYSVHYLYLPKTNGKI